MTNHYDELALEKSTLFSLSASVGANAFFAQEALRFLSMSGTLKNINFTLDKSALVDERHITHTISRSLLENYFWTLYIFDDNNEKNNRYEKLIDSFKRDYFKLTNEPMLPLKNQLEVADPSWQAITKGLDVSSMLAQVKNNRGDRLDYLYFIYRISSFDTHGKNLGTIGRSTFGKTVNFPVLEINVVFELIANQYLVILQKLRASGEI